MLVSIKEFNIDNGLPSNTVRCVFKDSKGLIWIGTQSGLVRYDGKNFFVFDESTGLVANEVMSIADYVYVVAEQKVIGQGTPDELRAHPSALVQQFLQGQSDGPVPFHFKAASYSAELMELAK